MIGKALEIYHEQGVTFSPLINETS